MKTRNQLHNLRILIYGAGAIGSLFAGKLAQAGFDLSILARNKRFEELENNGLILKDALNGKRISKKLPVIKELQENDLYDYIIVVVQNTQIDVILPVLARNISRNIVFVVNNPSGYQDWIDAVGYDRILIGFPAAGGERKAGEVIYFIGKGLTKIFQSTTFGELNGQTTKRLRVLIQIFKIAGFSPCKNKYMEDWQKTHVAVVVPIAKALYRFDSSNYLLSRSYDTIALMIKATRECFKALKAHGVRITPKKLYFYYFPLFLLTPIFSLVFNTRIAEFAMAKHTVIAQKEMNVLEELLRKIIKESGTRTFALDELSIK